MENIKKAFNLKVLSIATSITFLFTNMLYPASFSEDNLRPPIGTGDETLNAMEKVIAHESEQDTERNTPLVSNQIVVPKEIKKRFDNAREKQRDVLFGFMRDSSGKIQPLFSDSSYFESIRNILEPFNPKPFNPKREIRVIPLKVEKVDMLGISKSEDWEGIPSDIKDIFDKGNILVTSDSGTDSHYSLLMVVTPQDKTKKSEGRTGVLLKNGLPIVIDINGKEFIVEIKGVGNAEGGYDYDYKFLRGGAQVSQTDVEFMNLENNRFLNRNYNKGNVVRSLCNMHFDRGHGPQGYLIRLSPGSIRGSHANNNVLEFVNQDRYSERMSYCMGKQMAEFYSQGLIPCSHCENLITLDTGNDFIFTDYSDILPIYRFPGRVPGRVESLIDSPLGALLASLNTLTEITNYSYEAFLEGLTKGLLESGKIEKVDINILLEAKDFEDIANFIWEKFLLIDYYKIIKDNGYIPYYLPINCFNLDSESFKKIFLEKLVQGTKLLYKENKHKIEELELKSEAANYDEIKKLKAINEILESTKFTVNGMIQTTNSEEYKKIFMQHSKEYRVRTYKALWLWQLWNDNFEALQWLAYFLNKEIEFLEKLNSLIEPDFRREVEENIEIAKIRFEKLISMTPYDYHEEILKNPYFPFIMTMLPYHSKLKKDIWQDNGHFYVIVEALSVDKLKPDRAVNLDDQRDVRNRL